MANRRELKQIAEARLRTVLTLKVSKDWDGAAYMMGYVLECALKASACKTLNLETYPVNTKNTHIDNYFMTHRFDQLLIVSGLESVFSIRGPVRAFKNWSDFTKEYPGDWPSMRYDLNRQRQFTKQIVQRLYKNLKQILMLIKKNKK